MAKNVPFVRGSCLQLFRFQEWELLKRGGGENGFEKQCENPAKNNNFVQTFGVFSAEKTAMSLKNSLKRIPHENPAPHLDSINNADQVVLLASKMISRSRLFLHLAALHPSPHQPFGTPFLTKIPLRKCMWVTLLHFSPRNKAREVASWAQEGRW